MAVSTFLAKVLSLSLGFYFKRASDFGALIKKKKKLRPFDVKE